MHITLMQPALRYSVHNVVCATYVLSDSCRRMSVSMLSCRGVRKSQKQSSVNSSERTSVWHLSCSILGMASCIAI